MSTSCSIGLLGVSKNTAEVGVDSASAHWSRSVPSTMTVSTPQRGSTSSTMVKQAPKSWREATSRSPCPHKVARAVKTADMPDAVA